MVRFIIGKTSRAGTEDQSDLLQRFLIGRLWHWTSWRHWLSTSSDRIGFHHRSLHVRHHDFIDPPFHEF